MLLININIIMSVTVTQLNENIIKNSSINAYIHEQLEVIDIQIRRHDKTVGDNIVIYEIPSIMIAISTSRDVTELIIYHALIENLEKRGFKVRLKLDREQEKNFLVINWVTAVDNDEIEKLTKYLKQRTI